MKETWGHCTIDYAVLVAKEAGAKRLALFHHDPGHSDDELDAILDSARCTALHFGVPEVFSAYENLRVSLGD
jgi:ribonuclease BN (tRNA processing enzyme)